MRIIDKAAPLHDTEELRQEIISRGIHLRDRLGYFVSSWGNISVRVENGLLITPSRVEYHLIAPDDLVLLSWEGKRISGTRVPSSECELHRQLMLEREDVAVWIHHHAPWSSILAATRETLPVVADDMAELIGGEVRCTEHVIAGKHRELAMAARKSVGNEAWAVLLGSHGAVCGGRTLSEAVACCQILEKSSQIYVLGKPFGKVHLISREQCLEERDRYLHRYGKPEDLIGILGE